MRIGFWTKGWVVDSDPDAVTTDKTSWRWHAIQIWMTYSYLHTSYGIC